MYVPKSYCDAGSSREPGKDEDIFLGSPIGVGNKERRVAQEGEEAASSV